MLWRECTTARWWKWTFMCCQVPLLWPGLPLWRVPWWRPGPPHGTGHQNDLWLLCQRTGQLKTSAPFPCGGGVCVDAIADSSTDKIKDGKNCPFWICLVSPLGLCSHMATQNLALPAVAWWPGGRGAVTGREDWDAETRQKWAGRLSWEWRLRYCHW